EAAAGKLLIEQERKQDPKDDHQRNNQRGEHDRDPQGRPELIRLEEIEVVVEPDEVEDTWPLEVVLVQADPGGVGDWIANEQYNRDQSGCVQQKCERGIRVHQACAPAPYRGCARWWHFYCSSNHRRGENPRSYDQSAPHLGGWQAARVQRKAPLRPTARLFHGAVSVACWTS